MKEITVIKKGTSNGFLNPIDSGIRFGFIDREIEFEFQLPDREAPLSISFLIKFDESKQKFSLETEHSENRVEYVFYNPEKNGTSGMTTPQAAHVAAGKLIGFMFWVETMRSTSTIKFSYEFYGDTIDQGE